MTDLQGASSRAQNAGLSKTASPKQVVLPCQEGRDPETYEDCVLRELVVTLNDGAGKTVTVTLNGRRRWEPVAPSVYSAFKKDLTSHELVMEAVSGVGLPEASYGISPKAEVMSAVGMGPTPTRPKTEGRVNTVPTLKVTAKASDSSSHKSFGPAHPECHVGEVVTYGGAEAEKQIDTPDRQGLLENWLTLWPFEASRTVTQVIFGKACGKTKAACIPPMPLPLDELAVKLVVYPSLDVTVNFDGKPRTSASNSTERNLLKREGEKGSGVWGAVTKTETIRSKGATYELKSTTGKNYQQTSLSTAIDGGLTAEETQTYAGDNYSENYSLSQQTGPIGVRTHSLEASDSTNNGKESEESDRAAFSERLSITVTSAGKTATFKASDLTDFIDGLLKVGAAIKDLASVLSSFQIGWSVTYDYALFQGSLALSWALRWPTAYAEQNRVYYVERAVTVQGDMKIVQGQLTAKLGLDFDKGWLPIGAQANVSLTIVVGLSVAPAITYAYTNPDAKTVGKVSQECEGKFEITVTASAIGSARAGGYSMTLTASIQSKFTAKIKLVVAAPDPPALPASVTFDGAILSGYFENSQRFPKRVSFDPIELIPPHDVMRERDLWK